MNFNQGPRQPEVACQGASICISRHRRGRRLSRLRTLAFSTRMVSVVLVALLASALGCSRNYTSAVKAMNVSNIQKLGNFYSDFQASHGSLGPKDEAAFKSAISIYTPETMQLMGIDPNNRDAIWISERDHKPFKVRYGVLSPFGAVAAVVFEQDGIGGTRQVALNNSKVEEVDEARYKELWEGRGVSKPASTGAPAPGVPDAGAKK